MKTKTSFSPPTHAEIAAYAYHLWEAEGRLSGRDLDYWFQAKAHLVADRLYDAGMLEQITPVLLNSPRSPDAPARSKPARSLPEKPAPRGAARRARSPQEERAAA